MAVTFRIAEHSVHRGVQFVEVLLDEKVIGAIYPWEEQRGIRLVSVHMTDEEVEDGFAGEVVPDDRDAWPPIPAFHVRFDPGPWEIRDGRVVKLPREDP